MSIPIFYCLPFDDFSKVICWPCLLDTMYYSNFLEYCAYAMDRSCIGCRLLALFYNYDYLGHLFSYLSHLWNVQDVFCFLLPLLLLTVHCVSAEMLSVPLATLNQLLLYLLAPPFKNMMRSGRWVTYSWYINEDIVDINVFRARLARTGLQDMLLSWLHSIFFKRSKLTFDALSQYQEFPPGSNGRRIVQGCWLAATVGSLLDLGFCYVAGLYHRASLRLSFCLVWCLINRFVFIQS